ncbi:MAG: ribosome silencing factor [Planctomycetes bacterium]|nr:ribosome silencing factor [Planctomycetota bacterium]
MARLAAENRCRDIVVLDLREISPVTDFFVLATGTSRRQMQTVLSKITDIIKAEADVSVPYGTEGTGSDHWALVDMVDVIVHVFAPEARTYYALEMLWGDSPRIDWQAGWQAPAAAEE